MYENVMKFHDFQQFRPQKSDNLFLVGKTSGGIPQNFVGYRSRTLLENIIDGKTNYDFFLTFCAFFAHFLCNFLKNKVPILVRISKQNVIFFKNLFSKWHNFFLRFLVGKSSGGSTQNFVGFQSRTLLANSIEPVHSAPRLY